MHTFFRSKTPVSTFSLSTADWYYIASFMNNHHEEYEDELSQLKALQRVPLPPINNEPMIIVDTELGKLLKILFWLKEVPGAEAVRPILGRFRSALLTLPPSAEVNNFLTAVADRDNELEQRNKVDGRRILRGPKLT